MFFWNSLAFSMIQQMLAIWSLVPLPFIKPAWTSGSSRFMYCWRLAWRILSITLLAWDECNHAVVWAFFGIASLWENSSKSSKSLLNLNQIPYLSSKPPPLWSHPQTPQQISPILIVGTPVDFAWGEMVPPLASDFPDGFPRVSPGLRKNAVCPSATTAVSSQSFLP